MDKQYNISSLVKAFQSIEIDTDTKKVTYGLPDVVDTIDIQIYDKENGKLVGVIDGDINEDDLFEIINAKIQQYEEESA